MPDLQTANDFIRNSYSQYTQCVTGIGLVTQITGIASGVATPVVDGYKTLTAQVINSALLVEGVTLLTLGYKLIRPVNFVAGAYLGGTVSMLLLKIFLPAVANCLATITLVSASGLLLGVLCMAKRTDPRRSIELRCQPRKHLLSLVVAQSALLPVTTLLWILSPGANAADATLRLSESPPRLPPVV